MPRYHFNLFDSEVVADENGTELENDLEALAVARGLARRLLAERPELTGRHYSILVTDEDGDEIARMPLEFFHGMALTERQRRIAQAELIRRRRPQIEGRRRT